MKNLHDALGSDPDYWLWTVKCALSDAKENDRKRRKLWEDLENLLEGGDFNQFAKDFYTVNRHPETEKL